MHITGPEPAATAVAGLTISTGQVYCANPVARL